VATACSRPAAEGAQAGIDADARRADRGFKILCREGQGAGARERAEQHRGNHAAGGIAISAMSNAMKRLAATFAAS
jgi:hypothetical protein